MIDLAALEAWMDREEIGRGAIGDAVTLAGGTQNILLRFRRGDETFVLRRPPAHPRPESNETMRREARVLGALAGADVPHPRLIAACGDEAVLGCAFYLMEPVDGFNPVNGLPPLHAGSEAIRHRMGLAMAEAIAALGALDPVELGLGDFGKPDGYLERQVARWARQYAGYASFEGWPGAGSLPHLGDVGAWLEANRPKSFVPGLIHGDFHLANVMFRHDGPELAAVVDWELSTIGDPLIDLGWLLASWAGAGDADNNMRVEPWSGFPDADELVARYGERSSRDLSRVDWYRVFACYKLGILLEGTHARACAGLAPPETGARLHASAVRLFNRAANWAAVA